LNAADEQEDQSGVKSSASHRLMSYCRPLTSKTPAPLGSGTRHPRSSFELFEPFEVEAVRSPVSADVYSFLRLLKVTTFVSVLTVIPLFNRLKRRYA
jgi:hypothetical protein